MNSLSGAAARGRPGLRILGRALRWRRTGTVALLVVAVVAIAGSAVGPAFERAADASAFATSVATATPGSTDVSVLTNGGASALNRVEAIDTAVDRLGRSRQFAAPVVTVDAGFEFVQTAQRSAGASAGQGYALDLFSRTDVCAHVRLVSGSCPSAFGQAAVSARSARLAQLHVGETISLAARSGSGSMPVVLSGLYVPPSDTDTDYWGDASYFAFGTGGGAETALDALLTSRATALHADDVGAVPQISSTEYLRDGSLHPTGFSEFDRDVQAVITASGDRYGVVPTTRLFGFLAGADHDDHVAATVVEAVVLQLVLLALLVLYSLVGLSGADRLVEVDIARRRGFTRLALLVVATGEPAVLLLIALPSGLVVAGVAMVLIGRDVFVAGTPVGLDGPSLLAAVVAFAGGVAAAVVGSWGLWHGAARQTEKISRGRSGAAAVDAFAVALATAGLVSLSTRGSLGGSHPDPVVALAPGLIAVGAGVIGLRLAGLAVRAAVGVSGQSRHIAVFLAVREVDRRRPQALRQLLALSVAVVLIVFTVTSWALASDNRSAVAAFQTGADRVLDVGVAPGVNLVAAVRAADPSGREAMAVEVYESTSGQLLAVDASRLAAVMTWPSALTGLTARAVARYLAPPITAPIDLRAAALRVTVTLSAGAPPTSLSGIVSNGSSEAQYPVNFGTVHPGTGTYTASLDGACASGCRLVGVTPFAPDAPVAGTTTLAIDGLAAAAANGGWRSLAFGAGRVRSWTAKPTAVGVTTRSGANDVTFSVPDEYLSTQAILLSPADVPSPVPAVVTADLAAIDAPAPPDNAQSVTGLDGTSLTVAGEVEAPTLPEIGADAAMVDLTSAMLSQSGPSAANPEVWLARPATAGLLARLRDRGVTVVSTASAGTRTDTLDQSPLALAYRFVLDAAPIAALLGIGAAAVALLASGRRRRDDRRALRAIGLGPGVVVRAAVIETGIVLGAAWLVGGVAGVVAVHLALASLPQFTDGTGGIPISHAVPVVPVVASLGGLLVLFALTAAATIAAVFGRGRDGPEDVA